MKGLGRCCFNGFLDVINRFIFGHGVVIYYKHEIIKSKTDNVNMKPKVPRYRMFILS